MLKYLSDSDIIQARINFFSAIDQGKHAVAEGIYKALKLHWVNFTAGHTDVEDWNHLYITVTNMHDGLALLEPADVDDVTILKSDNKRLQAQIKALEADNKQLNVDVQFWANCFDNCINEVGTKQKKIEQLETRNSDLFKENFNLAELADTATMRADNALFEQQLEKTRADRLVHVIESMNDTLRDMANESENTVCQDRLDIIDND